MAVMPFSDLVNRGRATPGVRSKMHVVGHDYEGMRHVVPQGFSIVVDRVYHHLCNHW